MCVKEKRIEDERIEDERIEDAQNCAELSDDRAIHLTGSQFPAVILRHRFPSVSGSVYRLKRAATTGQSALPSRWKLEAGS